jgi:hypothetical protein
MYYETMKSSIGRNHCFNFDCVGSMNSFAVGLNVYEHPCVQACSHKVVPVLAIYRAQLLCHSQRHMCNGQVTSYLYMRYRYGIMELVIWGIYPLVMSK